MFSDPMVAGWKVVAEHTVRRHTPTADEAYLVLTDIRYTSSLSSVICFGFSLGSEDITRPTHGNKESSKHEAETKTDTECALVKQEPVTAAPTSRNQPEIALERQLDSKPVAGGSGVVNPPESNNCKVFRHFKDRGIGVAFALLSPSRGTGAPSFGGGYTIWGLDPPPSSSRPSALCSFTVLRFVGTGSGFVFCRCWLYSCSECRVSTTFTRPDNAVRLFHGDPGRAAPRL